MSILKWIFYILLLFRKTYDKLVNRVITPDLLYLVKTEYLNTIKYKIKRKECFLISAEISILINQFCWNGLGKLSILIIVK